MYLSKIEHQPSTLKSPFISNSNRKSNPNFMSSMLRGFTAHRIEKQLAKDYICAEFENNGFVAESVKKTVKLFKELFPHLALPDNVEFKSIDAGSYGHHIAYYHEVAFNSDLDCFKSKSAMKKEMSENEKFLGLPEWLSTSHYLHPFVHEFAHNAHYRNIEKRGNSDNWNVMSYMIPSAIGRLISKFKLGEYSNCNIKELMAERITKDICAKLTSNCHFFGDKSDLDYSHIFDNKWNCRYFFMPQAYLDYYVQQIWNGDMKKADDCANDVETYLKKLELQEIKRPSFHAKVKKKSLAGFLDAIAGIFTPQATLLDKFNKIKLKQ